MTQEQYDRLVSIVQFIMGGLAVVAAFLLAQPDLEVSPVVKVALGAFLAFAAYAKPSSLVRAQNPALAAQDGPPQEPGD